MGRGQSVDTEDKDWGSREEGTNWTILVGLDPAVGRQLRAGGAQTTP